MVRKAIELKKKLMNSVKILKIVILYKQNLINISRRVKKIVK